MIRPSGAPGAVRARGEQVQISDAGTGKVLDTETLASFSNWLYLDWKMSGNMLTTLTRQGGTNAVLNGLFLDAPSRTSAMSGVATAAGRLDGSLSSTIVTRRSGVAGIVAVSGDDNEIPFTPTAGAPRSARSTGRGAIGLTGDDVDRVLGDLADDSPASTQPARALTTGSGRKLRAEST